MGRNLSLPIRLAYYACIRADRLGRLILQYVRILRVRILVCFCGSARQLPGIAATRPIGTVIPNAAVVPIAGWVVYPIAGIVFGFPCAVSVYRNPYLRR